MVRCDRVRRLGLLPAKAAAVPEGESVPESECRRPVLPSVRSFTRLGSRFPPEIGDISGSLPSHSGHPHSAPQKQLPIYRSIQKVDAHIRRRLRAIVLKHWKSKRTTARRLIRLGVRPKTAWRRVYEGHQSIWALSHNPVTERGLRNAYFAERGLVTLLDRFELIWAAINAPAQLALPLGTTRS